MTSVKRIFAMHMVDWVNDNYVQLQELEFLPKNRVRIAHTTPNNWLSNSDEYESSSNFVERSFKVVENPKLFILIGIPVTRLEN